MKHLTIYILLLITFCYKGISQSKDTILLMNGNIVTETVLDTLIGAVTIVNPSNKLLNSHMAINSKGGVSTFIYSKSI